MKKLIVCFIILFTSFQQTTAQLRITEINTWSGENYVELYTPDTTLINLATDNYWLAIKTAASATWTFAQLTGSVGGTTSESRYFLFAQPATASRVPYTESQIDQVWTGGTDFFSDNVSNYTFLLKGNKIIDLFVSKSSQKNATLGVRALLSIPGQSGGANIPLTNVNVGILNYSVTASSGARASYQFLADATTCGSWVKAKETPKAKNVASNNNVTQLDPDFYYFSSLLKYDQTPGQTDTWITLNELAGLPSQNGSNLSTATNFEMLFQYELSSSNLNSITTSNPSLEVWVDQNEDKIFVDDPADAAVDVKLISGTDFTVVPVQGNTFAVRLLNPAGPKIIINATDKHNLYFKFKSTNVACYVRTNELIFQAGALPVNLKSFSVNAENALKLNKLAWTSSTETNNKGFEVQRSMGNTNDFKTIAFVGSKAKQGNSSSEISYSFEDADVKVGQTHYYRLNQIDFSGKSAFSPVKSIKPGSIESDLNIYPNPNQGSFSVKTGSASGKLNIFVMDNTGRVVNQYMNVSSTNTRISNLKKGFYTLKIVNTESGEQSAQRVVVQ